MQSQIERGEARRGRAEEADGRQPRRHRAADPGSQRPGLRGHATRRSTPSSQAGGAEPDEDGDELIAALEEQGTTEEQARDQLGSQVVIQELVADEAGTSSRPRRSCARSTTRPRAGQRAEGKRPEDSALREGEVADRRAGQVRQASTRSPRRWSRIFVRTRTSPSTSDRVIRAQLIQQHPQRRPLLAPAPRDRVGAQHHGGSVSGSTRTPRRVARPRGSSPIPCRRRSGPRRARGCRSGARCAGVKPAIEARVRTRPRRRCCASSRSSRGRRTTRRAARFGRVTAPRVPTACVHSSAAPCRLRRAIGARV